MIDPFQHQFFSKMKSEYMFNVNIRNTRTGCEICSSVSIVNFEQVNVDWVASPFLASSGIFHFWGTPVQVF